MKHGRKQAATGTEGTRGRTGAALKLGMLCVLAALAALTALTGCFPARNPENYYVNDSTALPEEIELGSYRLASLKYRNFKSSASYQEYYEHFRSEAVELRNSLFKVGDTEYNAPHYRELVFEGVIRSAGTKNDHFRPVKADEVGDFDMDETAHEVKRCIAVFDSSDNDTGYRIYIFDDEIWLGFFDKIDDVDWFCEDIFVLAKKKELA